jgi:hypothetical protein
MTRMEDEPVFDESWESGSAIDLERTNPTANQ